MIEPMLVVINRVSFCVASVKRALWLLMLLAPAAMVTCAAVTLDVCIELFTIARPAIMDMLKKELWLKAIAPFVAVRVSWVSWCTSCVLAPRLRATTALPALLARWLAVCRPDLALDSSVVHLVALLRDQEFGAAIGRSVAQPDRSALAHVRAQLQKTFGPKWDLALRLDPLPLGADCLVEAYRAVVREEALVKAQATQLRSRAMPWTAWHWWWSDEDEEPCPWNDGMIGSAQAFAEAKKVRSALVRVRRHGVAESAAIDIGLVRLLLRILCALGVLADDTETTFAEFVEFVWEQLDMRHEARLMLSAREAMGAQDMTATCARGVAVPYVIGSATSDVLVVSFEEGLLLSEVFRKSQPRIVPDDDRNAKSRAAAARRLAQGFWEVVFDQGIALGGLCASSGLLRAIFNDNGMGSKTTSTSSFLSSDLGSIGASCHGQELRRSTEEVFEQEVVALRCHLSHDVDERTRRLLIEFAAILRDGPPQRLGEFVLEHIHVPAVDLYRDPSFTDRYVTDPDSFVASAAELFTTTSSRRARGAALLQRVLALCREHRVVIGGAHLRLCAAVAAVQAVCGRLDPVHAGDMLGALHSAIAERV